MKDWAKPDDEGYINIPDELDPLVNRIGMQLRFHTIFGKNEVETIVHMVSIAQEFFEKLHNLTTNTQARGQEQGAKTMNTEQKEVKMTEEEKNHPAGTTNAAPAETKAEATEETASEEQAEDSDEE